MIRRGSQKFISSEPDPPLLLDLEQDPDELDNLADQPAHAERVQAFAAEVRERWDPQALYQTIVASQRTRRIAAEALAQGRRTPWEWIPEPHRGGYVSGEVDLNDLERSRRYPPPE
jgi:choline-sulfatase